MVATSARVMAVLLLGHLVARAQDGGNPYPEWERATAEENADCIDCHSDEEATMDFDDDTSVSVFIDSKVILASVHKDKLLCTDCHRNNGEFPHPDPVKKSQRDYSLSMYDLCRRCHFANYTRTLESVHFQQLAKQDAKAPTCVDCHGAHDTKPPDNPRADISRRCGSCHEEEFTVYAKSVHGQALLDEHNEDVPVCTDCHRAHDVVGPHNADFALSVPGTCGRCHADETRMRKYGLSTDVLQTFLADFHGVTGKLYRQTGESGRVVATCADCHGVHDIMSTRNREPAEIRRNLEKACQRCHEGAPVGFPDAWLPHYEATLTKAPLVFAVKVFYWVFIPLVIGGLLLQILLHIWRLALNR